MKISVPGARFSNFSKIACLQDCINGTLMPREMMPKKVNYTKLLGKFTIQVKVHNKTNYLIIAPH
jgi:hypothetical protein